MQKPTHMTTIKYQTLVSVLDKLSNEAPQEFVSYHPKENNIEGVNKARSRAFIHLFLKVRCNLTSFRERHLHVTDDVDDAGIDAYYFNEELKRLYLIQSKFRIDETNFKTKSITADEIIKMEITNVLKGKEIEKYNSKIKELNKKWKEIKDHANWEYEVVFLGNITRYTDDQIKKLIDNAKYQVFDFNKTYNELLYPLCCGTFFDPKEIKITINLNDDGNSILKRKINTKYGDFDVRVLFIPTQEVGRILSKYRNSILKFNPRNYLSLSQNKVNKGIRDSITNSRTNEFAILNNGITLLTNSFAISETTGEENVGQIIMTNPQIINGGQTAYTLSKIWDEFTVHHAGELFNGTEIFKTKEVLIKVIILKDYDRVDISLIEELSNSTNQQSKVDEADRRSNEKIQLEIQGKIFETFGYYYERKKGEFYYGLNGGYINKDLVIDRTDLYRSYMAFKGQPRWARQKGGDVLFKKSSFDSLIKDVNEYKVMFFAYTLLKKLQEIKDSSEWGQGLRYGKMSIISAVQYNIQLSEISGDNILALASEKIEHVKKSWLLFEQTVSSNKLNKEFYGGDKFDFDNYYKGKTVDSDIASFFGSSSLPEELSDWIAKISSTPNSKS